MACVRAVIVSFKNNQCGQSMRTLSANDMSELYSHTHTFIPVNMLSRGSGALAAVLFVDLNSVKNRNIKSQNESGHDRINSDRARAFAIPLFRSHDSDRC